MANIIWSAYDSVATILSTELNGLANDAATAPSAARLNVDGKIYADAEFVAGDAFSPTDGGLIELWFLRSVDNGSSYEDGNSGAIPARNPDAFFGIRGGSSITPRAGASGLVLPPGYYRVIARNRTGAVLPASGNLVRMSAYCESTGTAPVVDAGIPGPPQNVTTAAGANSAAQIIVSWDPPRTGGVADSYKVQYRINTQQSGGSTTLNSTHSSEDDYFNVNDATLWNGASSSSPIGASVNGHTYQIIGTASDGNKGFILITNTNIPVSDNAWGLTITRIGGEEGGAGPWIDAPAYQGSPNGTTVTISSSTLAIDNIGAQRNNIAFNVSAHGTGFTAQPPLEYSTNGSSWADLPTSASISINAGGGYDIIFQAKITSDGTFRVYLRVKDDTSIQTQSNPFAVTSDSTSNVLALRNSTANRHYLETGDGKCKFLVAAHTWNNFQTYPPNTLTYQAFIDNIVVPYFVASDNAQALMRTWNNPGSFGDAQIPDSDIPFNRSDTPGAEDGGNKWDLSSYNQAYFDKLLALVQYAGARKIHIQFMLFVPNYEGLPWAHPQSCFAADNNVNGSSPTNGTTEQQIGVSGTSATCLQLQKDYVSKVVGTLYDEPNVTYEIVNEELEDPAVLTWVNAMIQQVKDAETALGGVKHLVMNGAGAVYGGRPQWDSNYPSFQPTGMGYTSPGWGDIAPYDCQGNWGEVAAGGPYSGNVPSLMDTDHCSAGTQSWDHVWRSLCRGFGGFLMMDTGLNNAITGPMQSPLYSGYSSSLTTPRQGMLGVTRALSLINSLNPMNPASSLSSTGYCIADTSGGQFIIYQPNGGSAFTVDLSSQNGNSLAYYWIDATTGQQIGSVGSYQATASSNQSFTAPSNGGAAGLVFVRQTVIATDGTPTYGYGAVFMGESGWPAPDTMRDACRTNNLCGVTGIGGGNFAYNAPDWYTATHPLMKADSNISHVAHLLQTAKTPFASMTAAEVVTGMHDDGVRAWVDHIADQNFTRQAGYTGWFFVRINWEFNYPGTTPGGYISRHGNGRQDGGSSYWFNTGHPGPSGGSNANATATGGNFWAWKHWYELLSWNSPNSYARQKGVPCLIVWNPLCINSNVTDWDIPNGEFFYQYPIYSYPGDQYCDVHAIDLYSNSFWPTDSQGGGYFNTYPGYMNAAPFTRGYPRGNAVSLDEWWGGNDRWSNLWHWYDFTDATGGSPDGMPSSGIDLTGNNSCWGWSFAKAAMFASATGVFQGMTDIVSGLPRQKKPFGICECGIINGLDGGCGPGGGNGPFDAPNDPKPSFMGGGTGGGTDIHFWDYVASRFKAVQAMGSEVLFFIPWTCAVGTIQTLPMLQTIGPAFPGL